MKKKKDLKKGTSVQETGAAENNLFGQLNFLQKLIDTIPSPIFYKDTAGAYLGCNAAFENFIGVKRNYLIGKTVYDIAPKELADIYQEKDEELFKNPGVQNYGTSVVDKKGSLREVIFNKATFTRFDGKLSGLVGIITDITGQRRAEEELKEAKEFAENLIASMQDGITVINRDGMITNVNDAFCRMTGFTREELLGEKPPFHHWPEEHHDKIRYALHKTLMEESHDYELMLKRKNGEYFTVILSPSPIRNKGREIVSYLVTYKDITERKRTEDEMLKAQKLESLGVLAGGIAHDFNNLLTVILNNISLSLLSIGPGDESHKRLREAEKATLRAKGLTQQLLTFSKGGTPVKKCVPISEFLRESVSFALTGSNVRAEYHMQEGLSPVEADEGQLCQVISNLVMNACQAMPEGGVIRICGENVNVSDRGLPGLKEGACVRFSIEDFGVGIPEENLKKAFDPYFTTKEKGSGLGLANVYSIVKKHNGYVNVKSKVGAGTTFSVYLPASDKKIIREPGQKFLPCRPKKGKVLVMDDEETIRHVAGDMLCHLGFKVKFAKDGEEAVELYREAALTGEAFDAVILDLTIPGGIGGKEAVSRILEIDKNARAIVSSGYSNDEILSEFRNFGFSGAIEKPYRISELSEALHKVLPD